MPGGTNHPAPDIPTRAGRGIRGPSAYGGFKVKLTGQDVAVIVNAAGFQDDREAFDAPGHSEAAVAIAIAFAESGFYADATNRSVNGVAVGLFQIMQPSINPQYLDGQNNANLAYRMYSADDGSQYRFFGPWAGSNWKPHIAMADKLAKERREKNPSLGDQARNLNPLDEIGEFLSVLFSGALWLRVLMALAGLVLGFIALNTLLKQFGISVPLPYGATLGK